MIFHAVVNILPTKLGVRLSIKATGRKMVQAMLPPVCAACVCRWCSMLNLLMKWGTLVGAVWDFSPPLSAEVKTNCSTPDATAASTRSFPWRSSLPPAGVVTPNTPHIFEAWTAFVAALNMAGQSSRLPWTTLILGDRFESEVAVEEVALRVTARMVKLEAWGDASRASMQARPCLPVAPVMRRVLDILVSCKEDE